MNLRHGEIGTWHCETVCPTGYRAVGDIIRIVNHKLCLDFKIHSIFIRVRSRRSQRTVLLYQKATIFVVEDVYDIYWNYRCQVLLNMIVFGSHWFIMCEFRAFGKFVQVVVVPCCMSVTRASDNSKSSHWENNGRGRWNFDNMCSVQLKTQYTFNLFQKWIEGLLSTISGDGKEPALSTPVRGFGNPVATSATT